jgi:hypothetical protein
VISIDRISVSREVSRSPSALPELSPERVAATAGDAVFDRGRGMDTAEMGDSAFKWVMTIDLLLCGVD